MSVSRKTYVAVAGNIGSGKSTLVKFLCDYYNMDPFFEPNDDNPYLEDFYNDMKRWGFHSQLHFLAHKFQLQLELDRTEGFVLQDRTLFEDAEIFARVLWQQGALSDREWSTYSTFYSSICEKIRAPDLMIFLRCEVKTLKKRIATRGRTMERQISTQYLTQLNECYEDWISRYAQSEIIVLDNNRFDYRNDWIDRIGLTEMIEKKLPSLERRSIQEFDC